MTSIDLARRIRIHSLKMIHKAKASHIGSCLSVADILAVLYADVMTENDRLILSKGHAAAAQYAAIAEMRGWSPDFLDTFCRDGSILQGHVSADVPNVSLSTGSLGHGLPVAAGMALAAKMNAQDKRIFCVMSDGELQAGSVWEGAWFARTYYLDNLVTIVDYNGLQGLGPVLGPTNYIDKFAAFGWYATACDGHNHVDLREALTATHPGPLMLLCNTIKGKGVSFMENRVEWHYKNVNDEELARALEEVG